MIKLSDFWLSCGRFGYVVDVLVMLWNFWLCCGRFGYVVDFFSQGNLSFLFREFLNWSTNESKTLCCTTNKDREGC